MKELALKILQEETDGFYSQSRLRDDVIDAMIRFKNESEQLTIPGDVEQIELLQGFFEFYKKKFGEGFNTDVLEITLRQYHETMEEIK